MLSGAHPGSRFFQGCLAKGKGSTSAEYRDWRRGIYDEIRAGMQLQGKLTVERMCQLTGVSRAGFYRHLVEVEPDEEEMELRDAIQRIYLEHRRHYGYRRITAELRHRGMLVNRKRVARLMSEDNLIAVRQRKFVMTTDSKHDFQVYLNLAARMEVTAVNQLWVADITYIRLPREFVFLAVILDAYSRRVVGRCLARSLRSELTLTAVQQAIESRRPQPGLVHHSDRGVQYACREYTDLLEAHGIIPSMSRPGNPWDNASCESFMKTLKQEEIYCRDQKDYEDLDQHLDMFIDHYYNRQRLHSALGYRTPADFEAAIAVVGERSGVNAITAAPRMSFFQP